MIRQACLLVVVLDFGELGIDHVLATGATGHCRHAGSHRPRPACCEAAANSACAGFFERLGLGFDLRLVVALHGGFQFGDRAFDAADDFAADLVAVSLIALRVA